MTGQGFINVFNDKVLHQYIIDFAKSNIVGEGKQEQFVKDVWCDVGCLKHEEPSLHQIAEVAWRQMIRREPILARLSEGYSQEEVAAEYGTYHQDISRKLRKKMRKKRRSG